MFSIQFRYFHIRAHQVFRSARGVIDGAECLEFEVKLGQLTGIGRGVFPKGFDPECESLKIALAQLLGAAKAIGDRLRNDDWASLLAPLASYPWLESALEIALMELEKVPRRPLAHSIRCSGFSLPSVSKSELFQKLHPVRDYPILKLKVSEDFDMEQIRIIRKLFRGRLWLDANSTWTWEETLRRLPELHKYGVELIEDPLKSADPEDYARLRRLSPVSIVLDECIRTTSDLYRYQDSAHVVNLKFFKCGGPSKVVAMATVAKKLGLKVMLGCKTESVVSIQAMAALASWGDYWDLDGHVDLDEPLYPGFRWLEGYFTHCQKPGPGFAKYLGYENLSENSNETRRFFTSPWTSCGRLETSAG